MLSATDREWIDLFFRAASRKEVLARELDRLAVRQEARATTWNALVMPADRRTSSD